MYKIFIYSISFIILLTTVSSVQAVPFSLVPTFDGHVSNDADEGPDASPGGSGMRERAGGGALGGGPHPENGVARGGRALRCTRRACRAAAGREKGSVS